MAGLVAENFGIAVMPEIPILKNLNVDVLDIENPPYERYISGEAEGKISGAGCKRIY